MCVQDLEFSNSTSDSVPILLSIERIRNIDNGHPNNRSIVEMSALEAFVISAQAVEWFTSVHACEVGEGLEALKVGI